MVGVFEAIQPVVTEGMNGILTEDFSSQEMGLALKQMASLKTPSPDGMPSIFYQHYWKEIGSKSWFEVGVWLLGHVEQWSLGLEALRFLGPYGNKS